MPRCIKQQMLRIQGPRYKDDSLDANLSQGHSQGALKQQKKFVLKETVAKDLTDGQMEGLNTTSHLELKSAYL